LGALGTIGKNVGLIVGVSGLIKAIFGDAKAIRVSLEEFFVER
jgi:hypothetical protein